MKDESLERDRRTRERMKDRRVGRELQLRNFTGLSTIQGDSSVRQATESVARLKHAVANAKVRWGADSSFDSDDSSCSDEECLTIQESMSAEADNQDSLANDIVREAWAAIEAFECTEMGPNRLQLGKNDTLVAEYSRKTAFSEQDKQDVASKLMQKGREYKERRDAARERQLLQ